MSSIYILQAAQCPQSELWLNIDWKRCNDVVMSLQNRIVKFVRNGEWQTYTPGSDLNKTNKHLKVN